MEAFKAQSATACMPSSSYVKFITSTATSIRMPGIGPAVNFKGLVTSLMIVDQCKAGEIV